MVHCSHHHRRRSCIRYAGAGPLSSSYVTDQETDTETFFGADHFRYAEGGHHNKFLIPHLIYLITPPDVALINSSARYPPVNSGTNPRGGN